MSINARDVADLRAKTGAGMMDCKSALAAAGGDMEKAVDELRKKGLAKAAKKAGRIAAEGMVASYIHGGGKIGVLVEVNSETDFVAKNEDFKNFVRDVAMHIAAKPDTRFVRSDEIPTAVIAKEREILMAQALEEGKPANVVEKMVEGRVNKWFKEVCLVDQPFVRDEDVTIQDLTNNLVAKIGEKIDIRRFVRWELGEGLEKRSEDFAAEVAKAAAAS